RLSPYSVSKARESHNFVNLDYQALIVLTQIGREVMYQKINQRAYQMIEDGLISETENLLLNFGNACPALKSIGYNEVLKFLSQEITKNELPELIAKNTRHLAKKQITFWRNEPIKRGWERDPNIYSKLETIAADLSLNLSKDSSDNLGLDKTSRVFRTLATANVPPLVRIVSFDSLKLFI
ncbi:MAG: tRNA dimethylallyltransferase, partial [Candidatus Paceibacterota bacterium]